MLNWVVIFLGFASIAIQAAGIAQILFFIFLALFVLSLITHIRIGRNNRK